MVLVQSYILDRIDDRDEDRIGAGDVCAFLGQEVASISFRLSDDPIT